MSLKDEGITSYCDQVCGSRGSTMCGTGQVCQLGIDVDTRMPADPSKDVTLMGPEAPQHVVLANHLQWLANQSLANDGIAGIGMDGAIKAMLPYWKVHFQDGAGLEAPIQDLKELHKQLGLCIDILEIPF